MTSNLDHTSLWREVSFEDDQASIWLERVGDWTHNILALCLHRLTRLFTDRLSARSHLCPIDGTGSNEALYQKRYASGTIQVNSHIASARLEIGQQRGTLADRIKIVDGEGNAGFTGHGEQMQHGIGRTTRCSHTSDSIFKSLARQDITRASRHALRGP